MFEIDPTLLINYLHKLPNEIISLLNLIFCYFTIIFMARMFGAEGLLVYNVIAFLISNMQVLKAADFMIYKEPIALGSIVYCSSFLASDGLTELYSAKYAKKSLMLSFFSSIAVLIIMILTLGHREISSSDPSHHHFKQAHEALSIIFKPNVAILFASLISYLVSIWVDINIFNRLKGLTAKSKLWLRTLLSVSAASFVDAIIFNILAWKIFSPYNISWDNLFFNYMLGGFSMQLFVAIFNIPTMYILIKVSKTRSNKTN